MSYQTCEDCGCRVYSGHCVNCHEETFIAEQNYSNDEPIAFSEEFLKKVEEQKEEAKEIIEAQKQKELKQQNENPPNE